ncbi:M20/M25/M40 family metallo-hydrolase [Novosphingobium sp. BL-52-GroH]|uniref:M20/M25/M40 family metallo-hydrolase n=1 Tax=Novosphingobium sp. BL-52-GroH TaxID=3349877 RepID=UPI00384CAB2F
MVMSPMRKLVATALLAGSALALVSCDKPPEAANDKKSAVPQGPKLGIRPAGDTEAKIDMSAAKSPDLKKIFSYIDENIDSHVYNLQKWIQQPSISNTGEGIPESAEMVKGFFDQLGCQKTQVYDVGKTEFGQQGNPVVYAHCDEGAEKTLVVYWMYDTMPVTQPDLWKAPPFEGRLVEQAPYKKVLIGRGAVNSKGPQMAMWNALMSIKAVTGKLPVNLIFVAEGDEERMSIGYRKFIREHPELVKDGDAMYTFGGQSPAGGAFVLSGSEGCVFVELTTSGKKWGRGPNYSDIHGGFKRSVDAPAWRHIKMLSTLTDETGNRVMIDGFYDNMEPLSKRNEAVLKGAAKGYDLKKASENLGVERFISDDPYEVLKMSGYGTSINIDGIWGGNMFPGGSGAILPNKITSKHNFRYIPNMNGMDIVKKLRRHLDKHGFSDVEINVVGDVPWAKRSTDTEIGRALMAAYDAFGIPHAPINPEESIMGGYWPAYLFSGDTMNIPIAGGMAGLGGNAHAANEYYVIEGAGKVYGMAGAEKSVAMVLYNFAGKNGPIPGSRPAKPK